MASEPLFISVAKLALNESPELADLSAAIKRKMSAADSMHARNPYDVLDAELAGELLRALSRNEREDDLCREEPGEEDSLQAQAKTVKSGVHTSDEAMWKPSYVPRSADLSDLTFEQRNQQMAQRQAISCAILRTLADIIRHSTVEDELSMLHGLLRDSCLLNVYHTHCFNVVFYTVIKAPQLYHSFASLALTILRQPLLSHILHVNVRNTSFKLVLRMLSTALREAIETESFSDVGNADEFIKSICWINSELESLLPYEAEIVEVENHTSTSTPEVLYERVIKPLIFAVDDDPELVQTHCFLAAIQTESASPYISKSRHKSVMRELKGLASQLPLHFGSTVAVRVCEDHPQLLRAIITAPANTPYDSGCFEFHIYCVETYPDNPPKVNLMTTGNGTVRFSPNLYDSGYVCLSLLGTWSGRPEEGWSAESNIWQVLVSIQSQILGAELPFFSEPGMEGSFGSTWAMRQARTSVNGGYERLRVATIQHAMTDQLVSPPLGFEEFVRCHFWLKRRHIIATIDGWVYEARESDTIGHLNQLVSAQCLLIEQLRKLSYLDLCINIGASETDRDELQASLARVWVIKDLYDVCSLQLGQTSSFTSATATLKQVFGPKELLTMPPPPPTSVCARHSPPLTPVRKQHYPPLLPFVRLVTLGMCDVSLLKDHLHWLGVLHGWPVGAVDDVMTGFMPVQTICLPNPPPLPLQLFMNEETNVEPRKDVEHSGLEHQTEADSTNSQFYQDVQAALSLFALPPVSSSTQEDAADIAADQLLSGPPPLTVEIDDSSHDHGDFYSDVISLPSSNSNLSEGQPNDRSQVDETNVDAMTHAHPHTDLNDAAVVLCPTVVELRVGNRKVGCVGVTGLVLFEALVVALATLAIALATCSCK